MFVSRESCQMLSSRQAWHIHPSRPQRRGGFFHQVSQEQALTGQHEFRRHCILHPDVYIYNPFQTFYAAKAKINHWIHIYKSTRSNQHSSQMTTDKPSCTAFHLEKASEHLSQCPLHVNLFNSEVGSFFKNIQLRKKSSANCSPVAFKSWCT